MKVKRSTSPIVTGMCNSNPEMPSVLKLRPKIINCLLSTVAIAPQNNAIRALNPDQIQGHEHREWGLTE